jgi:hypothetical protein
MYCVHDYMRRVLYLASFLESRSACLV